VCVRSREVRYCSVKCHCKTHKMKSLHRRHQRCLTRQITKCYGPSIELLNAQNNETNRSDSPESAARSDLILSDKFKVRHLHREFTPLLWLCCTVPHYIMLHCTVLYCTALHYTVLHCTALHCTAPCYAVLYCSSMLCCTAPCYAVLYCNVLYCAVVCCAVLCCDVLISVVLHCTAVCCALLLRTSLCGVVLRWRLAAYHASARRERCCM
jgi:hypothetical protein